MNNPIEKLNKFSLWFYFVIGIPALIAWLWIGSYGDGWLMYPREKFFFLAITFVLAGAGIYSAPKISKKYAGSKILLLLNTFLVLVVYFFFWMKFVDLLDRAGYWHYSLMPFFPLSVAVIFTYFVHHLVKGIQVKKHWFVAVALFSVTVFLFVFGVLGEVNRQDYVPQSFEYSNYLAKSQHPKIFGWPFQFVISAYRGTCSFCYAESISLLPFLANSVFVAIILLAVMWMIWRMYGGNLVIVSTIFSFLSVILLLWVFFISGDMSYSWQLWPMQPGQDWFYMVGDGKGG